MPTCRAAAGAAHVSITVSHECSMLIIVLVRTTQFIALSYWEHQLVATTGLVQVIAVATDTPNHPTKKKIES